MEKITKPLLIVGIALIALFSLKTLFFDYSENPTLMRIWVTNTGEKPLTKKMTETMQDFMNAAVENGAISATFADDNERAIAFTMWPDKTALEAFKKTESYKVNVDRVLAAFISAGYEFPGDVLFNTDAEILGYAF